MSNARELSEIAAAITVDGSKNVSFTGNSSSTNLAYTGTLTGSTGVVNLGSGQFYKDASGNVGIGTSSPSQKLSVIGNIIGSQSITIGTGGLFDAGSIYSDANWGMLFRAKQASPNLADFAWQNAGGTERMRIDASGNVGIGTSSPAQKLDIQTANGTNAYVKTTSGTVDVFYGSSTGGFGNVGAMGTGSSHPQMFFTNSTERMRIDSSGNLLVGNTSSGLGTTRFYVENNGTNITTIFAATGSTSASVEVSRYYHVGATGATNATMLQFLATNGAGVGSIVSNGTATLFQTSSDYRLKTVVAPVSDSGTRLDALQPIEYDWKSGGRTRGFLAHQFAEVYPSSVSGEKDAVDVDGKPVYQGMQASSTEVMADLIAEIQSLRKRVAQLESN